MTHPLAAVDRGDLGPDRALAHGGPAAATSRCRALGSVSGCWAQVHSMRMAASIPVRCNVTRC